MLILFAGYDTATATTAGSGGGIPFHIIVILLIICYK